MPLNCALAFETEIVFIRAISLMADHGMVSHEVKNLPNQHLSQRRWA